MNTQQAAIDSRPAKFKTTLYLTEHNRQRLDKLTKGTRTQLINQAIAEKLEKIEQEMLQKKLLNLIDNVETVPSNGVSTEKALHEIRARELHNLISNK